MGFPQRVLGGVFELPFLSAEKRTTHNAQKYRFFYLKRYGYLFRGGVPFFS
jgi:hypothetical protein